MAEDTSSVSLLSLSFCVLPFSSSLLLFFLCFLCPSFLPLTSGTTLHGQSDVHSATAACRASWFLAQTPNCSCCLPTTSYNGYTYHSSRHSATVVFLKHESDALSFCRGSPHIHRNGSAPSQASNPSRLWPLLAALALSPTLPECTPRSGRTHIPAFTHAVWYPPSSAQAVSFTGSSAWELANSHLLLKA